MQKKKEKGEACFIWYFSNVVVIFINGCVPQYIAGLICGLDHSRAKMAAWRRVGVALGQAGLASLPSLSLSIPQSTALEVHF